MSGKPLLTEAELTAIAKRDATAAEFLNYHSCDPQLVADSQFDVERLLADLHRYRAWCQRLAKMAGHYNAYELGDIPLVVNEIAEALEESQQ